MSLIQEALKRQQEDEQGASPAETPTIQSPVPAMTAPETPEPAAALAPPPLAPPARAPRPAPSAPPTAGWGERG